jgi:toxin ParE1/3/4
VADGVRIVLGEHAVDDLRRARDHYAAIDPALSAEFASAFDAVVERIRIFPRGATPVDGLPGLRRARMRRFPDGVLYRDGDEAVIVLRVLHNARDAVRHLP